jgi:F0F1-type ATP synthase membrane subunit b/b'
MQQLVDKALGFDRKKFNEIEDKLKEIADNKQLSAEEREQQSKALNEQRDAMLQDAMDRLTGKKSEPKEETKSA